MKLGIREPGVIHDGHSQAHVPSARINRAPLIVNAAAAGLAVLLSLTVYTRHQSNAPSLPGSDALADMVTRTLSSGDLVSRAHPLVPMAGQVVHDVLRRDVNATFMLMNVVSLAVLAFVLCALLDRFRASIGLKVLFVAHVALSLPFAKLPAVHPVGIELPAYALVTLAVHAILGGRRLAVVVATVAAVMAHWAALLIVLFGWMRDRRHGLAWTLSAATYAPALAVVAGLYWWSASVGDAEVPGLVQRVVRMLTDVPTHPGRVLGSLIALIGVCGGVSLVVLSAAMRRKLTLDTEWLAYGAAIAALALAAPAKAAALGGFGVPLVAAAWASTFPRGASAALVGWTALATLWTQQPWHPYAEGTLLWPGMIRGTEYWLAWAISGAFVAWFLVACGAGERKDFSLVAFGCTMAVLLSMAADFSGVIQENNGLGYDGEFYVRMIRDGYAAGTWDTRLRPAVVLLNQLANRVLDGDALSAFRAMNLVYAFGLGVVIAAICRRYQASVRSTVILVVNLGLCISTATMFAYYPTLIDLGAYFITSGAVLMIIAGRPLLAAVASVLAVSSREFGLVAVLFGVARDVRIGRGPARVAATYLPAIVAFAMVRYAAAAGPTPDGTAHLTLFATAQALLSNLALWVDPRYVIFWFYFALTVFGGISVLLVVSSPLLAARLRAEPEWLAIIVPVVIVTALGRTDTWRYAAFLLPAVPALWAWTVAAARRERLTALFVCATAITVVTQWPWRRLDDDLYFRDWFPYFALTELDPLDALPVWPVWQWRIAAAAVGAAIAFLAVRWASAPSLESSGLKSR